MKHDLPEPLDGRGAWKEFLCRACGLIYNEGEGDADSGIAPGTRFEDIPEDWVCPICGVSKADFEPYERPSAPAVTALRPGVGRSPRGVVIVGAGLAGWAMARALRELDETRPITIVTACAGDVYNKPELSLAMSRDASFETLRRASGADEAARLGIRLVPHTHVVGLTPRFRRLRTTRGPIDYTHCIFALGARARIPAGLEARHAWRVNSLGAWHALRAHMGDGPRHIAVVGAGMIGCELAEDFARAGHRVTLIDPAPLPLDALIPPEAGRRLQAGLRRAGVDHLAHRLVRASHERDDGRICLTLDDETAIEVDHVIAATGLALDTRFLRNAGLEVSPMGIVVDAATLATSVAAVHALGDCVAIDGAPCRFIEPIPEQAEAIAHAISGREHPGYSHRPPLVRLKTRETPMTLEGRPLAEGEWRLIEDTPDRLVMERWHRDVRVARLVA